MLHLRILSIIAAIPAFAYFYLVISGPLWVNMFWTFMTICINIIQIVILIYDRREIEFSNEYEKKIYHTIFYKFVPGDFRKLLRVGKFITVQKGQLITEFGRKVNHISIIVKGIAAVKIKNELIAYCKEGNFVGEISFISGKPATASVEALEETICLQWEQKDIHQLVKKYPHIKQEMLTVFNQDLINKLN